MLEYNYLIFLYYLLFNLMVNSDITTWCLPVKNVMKVKSNYIIVLCSFDKTSS